MRIYKLSTNPESCLLHSITYNVNRHLGGVGRAAATHQERISMKDARINLDLWIWLMIVYHRQTSAYWRCN